MSFLSGIFDAVKKKQAELKDRKDFVDMVEQKARPIRRAAYMQQMLKEVVSEGIEKAKQDAEKKTQKTKKPEDFGINMEDPMKYLQPTKKKRSSI